MIVLVKASLHLLCCAASSIFLCLIQLTVLDFLQPLAQGKNDADYGSQDYSSVKQQYAAYIEKCALICAERALEGTQGAGAYRTGAGVAVDAGNADAFGASPVDITSDEALEIDVEQQRKV